MPGENLTRIEAQQRAAILRVHSYDVDLDLTRGAEVFGSRTTIRFSATAGEATFLDAITRAVHSVTLNGRELDPSVVADGVRIQLADLAAENEVTVVADGIYTNTGEGLHRFVDPADGEVYLYSQFEVPDSRRMFAVFEQPDLKATFRFTVTAPDYWQVVSNSPTPEPVDVGENTFRWDFAPTPVISSYITALIAGPYAVERRELTSADGRIIPLGVFSRASLAQYVDTDYIVEKTRQGFEFYERIFDYPYPFEKYDQLFVPEFNAGAMENAGAVTFTESYVFRSKVTAAARERRVITILHELAHMWFGDLVTMRWWNDLWLNESFATYISTLAGAEATEWGESWTTFGALEKSWAYRQDQLPSTHPIVADIRDLEDVQVNFDGITYAKGASVIRQLVAWVGEKEFLAGVAAYFRKYRYANTELADLLAELELTSGRDLSAWSALWLETAGVNTLSPELEVDKYGTITSFAVLQSAPADWPTLRPHRLGIGLYDLVAADGAAAEGGAADGASSVSTAHGVRGALDRKLVRRGGERLEFDIDGSRTPIDALVGQRRPDLILLNDDDLAYAKIRLDPASLSAAIGQLSNIASPLARSLVWGSVWDSTRDAETPARDYVRLVLGNIATETESTTLRTTLGQVTLAATQYVTPSRRTTSLTELGDALLRFARAAEGGSDAQFQFLRAFASVASTPAHLDAVQAIRDGSEQLPGLDIDTDLGWELLIALVAGGRAGQAEIDAALAADSTATGQQSAAQATAAFPTVAGKQAAWNALVRDSTASNLIVRSTALGFQRVIDPDLLAPFVPQYFAALNDLWQTRSYAIASAIIGGAYPAALANRQLVDATRAWLDANPDTPALRRLVIENLAGVERALAAQSRDAE